jgi:ribose-phosphate pyrophosphokinase
MIETLRHLGQAHMRPAVCLAVHGIFAGKAYQDLFEAGAERVVTCNTIPHESNAIDVTDLLAEAVRDFLSTNAGRGESSTS